MGDLNLHGLALVAGFVWRLLPDSSATCADELAGEEDPLPFLRVQLAFSATERHAVQRKKPSVTSCHSPLCLERWLTATVKPAGAAPLCV